MLGKKIRFNDKGKLTILQVSDAQDMHIPRKAMFKMLEKVYDKVKPDLVILTGDNILGNHIDDARFLNRKNTKSKEETLERMKKALRFLLKPINDRKIPFAMIFGNHDDMNCITKEEQAEIYKSYKYCVGFSQDDESPDCATYNLPIYSSGSNEMKYNLWMLDSAWHDKKSDNCFSYVKEEAVQWYIKKSEQLEKENGKKIMSLMFQHIPFQETRELFKPCDKNTKGAVPNRKDKNYYVLDSEKASGYALEFPEVCEKNVGQLDAIKQRKDVCGIVFGHDHTNSFTAQIDGVNIIQTPGASFRCYGTPVTRGVRVFTIDENEPESLETYTIGYFDLFGKNFKSILRYIFNADEMEKTKTIIIALLCLIGSGLLVSIILSMFGY